MYGHWSFKTTFLYSIFLIEHALRMNFRDLGELWKSRGLLLGWKVNYFLFKNVWVIFSSIGISLYFIELEMNLCCANIYVLYQKWDFFWNNMLSKDYIEKNNIIMGWELNFSLGKYEICGPADRVDNLFYFCAMKTFEHGLLDIEPSKLFPTWSNKRVGHEILLQKIK